MGELNERGGGAERTDLKVGDTVSVKAESIRHSIAGVPFMRNEQVPDGTHQGTITVLGDDKAKILFTNISGGEITYVIPISEIEM